MAWTKIQDWQLEDLPYPGDKIDAVYDFTVDVLAFPVTLWLGQMEAEFQKSLLFHYDGYTITADRRRIAFHFTVLPYEQDDSGQIQVLIMPGQFAKERIDPAQAGPGNIGKLIIGAMILYATISFLHDVGLYITDGPVHRIQEDPTLTPEQKAQQIAALHVGEAGWSNDLQKLLSSGMVLVIVVIIGLLILSHK
jgi:hypothetical protein